MRDEIVANCFVGVICVVFGFSVGSGIVAEIFRREAIQHGAAHYDAVSGEFTWNDEE